MYYILEFPTTFKCEPLDEEYNVTFTVPLEESLEDIFHFEYYKKYNKYYNELSWYLEPGAKEMRSLLEEQWWSNKLDTYKYYHDPEFIEFLKKKHNEDLDSNENLREEFDREYHFFRDDLKASMEYMEASELEEVTDVYGMNFDIIAETPCEVKYCGNIDVQRILEDKDDEEDY